MAKTPITITAAPTRLITPLVREALLMAPSANLKTLEGLEAWTEDVRASRHPEVEEITKGLEALTAWFRSKRPSPPRKASAGARKTSKKTAAQLQSDIDEVLARPPAKAPPPPTKTPIYHIVQGNYGYGHGWEDLTAEDTESEAKKRLREYRENEPGVSHRLIRRRLKRHP